MSIKQIVTLSSPMLLVLSTVVSYISWLMGRLALVAVAGGEPDLWFTGIIGGVSGFALITVGLVFGLNNASPAKTGAWIAGPLVTLLWTSLQWVLMGTGLGFWLTTAGALSILWILLFWVATVAAVGIGRVLRARRVSAGAASTEYP